MITFYSVGTFCDALRTKRYECSRYVMFPNSDLVPPLRSQIAFLTVFMLSYAFVACGYPMGTVSQMAVSRLIPRKFLPFFYSSSTFSQTLTLYSVKIICDVLGLSRTCLLAKVFFIFSLTSPRCAH